MIVYPLVVALYGMDLRQPIGGDFSFNLEMARHWASQRVWLTDVAKFGIDIWMTLSAISEKFKIGQIDLGTKIHNSKDPAEELGPMFYQVFSTLFYTLGIYEKCWRHEYQYTKIDVIDNDMKSEPSFDMDISFVKLKKEFVEGLD